MIIGSESDKTAAVDLSSTDRVLRLKLRDGREVAAPLDLYPTLRDGQPAARRNWGLLGEGRMIHWPDLDLCLTTRGIVMGNPERFPPPPKLRRRPIAEGERIFHVSFRKRQGWIVWQEGEREAINVYPTKPEAQSEAISLGRMVGPSCVWVHRKTEDKVMRRIPLGAEREKQEEI